MRNRITLFTLLFTASVFSFAQTSLSPGDLAFTSYTSDNPDEFSFILLEDVDSATIISFTDHGWLSTGAFRANAKPISFERGKAASLPVKISVGWLSGVPNQEITTCDLKI